MTVRHVTMGGRRAVVAPFPGGLLKVIYENGDQEFVVPDDDAEVGDFNPYHEPAGSEHGGEFAHAGTVGTGFAEAPIYIRQNFPSMQKCQVVNGPNLGYNCAGDAFGDETRWWWPGSMWPRSADEGVSVRSFDKLLIEKLGGRVTKSELLEKDYVKIALFTDDGTPTHVARLVSSGVWQSKLGGTDLIRHRLRDMEGGFYGRLRKIYRVKESEWRKLRKMGMKE